MARRAAEFLGIAFGGSEWCGQLCWRAAGRERQRNPKRKDE